MRPAGGATQVLPQAARQHGRGGKVATQVRRTSTLACRPPPCRLGHVQLCPVRCSWRLGAYVVNSCAKKPAAVAAAVRCPEPSCAPLGPVEAHHWRDLLSRREFEAVTDLAAEASIAAARLFCPHRECSATLLAPARPYRSAADKLDCPHCSRWAVHLRNPFCDVSRRICLH